MNLKKYILLAALPMIFTACQEDMLVENTPDQGITTLTASMDRGTDSRAQIVLNGTNTSKEFFHWNKGDEFTLFAGKNVSITPHVFTISSDYDDNAPAASADFTTSTALTDGQEFIAFYPSPVMSEEAPSHVDLKINNTLPDNSETSWVNYFKNNMFMMKQGTVATSLNIQFEHLCGIVRITYNNTSSVPRTIKGIYVNGSWGSGVGYNIWDELEITGGSGYGGRYGIKFENKVTIAANTSENFYILFMQNLEPEENKESLTHVEIELENNNYKCTPDYSRTLPLFEVGKSYWLNVTDNGNEIFWTNDGLNNPSQPEEDVDTFDKLKNAINAPQQSDNMTSIRLASDIILTEQLVINKPIQLIMDGHTLTLGYTLQEKEGAIINNSDLYITKKGTIKAPSTGTEVDAYLIKSGAGKVDLRYVTIDAGIVKNAVYIKDGTGLVYETATINASGYTLDIESDSYSDVDIYTGTLNGDVRWTLNSAQYTKLCRFGAGPNSTIKGDLVWAGEYGGNAQGYKIEFGTPVNIEGENWPQGNAEGGNSENEVGVRDYAELTTALSNPNITKISFANDIAIEGPLEITRTVQLDLQKHRMTINTSKFQGGASLHVIEVKNDGLTFYLDNGVVDFTGYTGKMNSCIRTSGKNIQLNMADIDITLGNNFGRAIWLDDDKLRIESGYKTPTITATNAIYYDSQTAGKEYKSTVKANINGNVEFKSTTNIGLNTTFDFLSGCINGSLNIGDGIGDNVNIADHVKINKGVVTFGEKASNGDESGWSKAGFIQNSGSENQEVEVTNIDQLYNALNTSNVKHIVLLAPITIDSELNLRSKTLSLSDNFDFGGNDAAISFTSNQSDKNCAITNGKVIGSTSVQGKYLIKCSNHNLEIVTANLVANGNLNGVHVTAEYCGLVYGASIEVENGHAIKMLDNGSLKLSILNDAIVTGDIYLEANSPGLVKLDRQGENGQYGKVIGNIIISGMEAANIEVYQQREGLLQGTITRIPSGDIASGKDMQDGGVF